MPKNMKLMSHLYTSIHRLYKLINLIPKAIIVSCIVISVIREATTSRILKFSVRRRKQGNYGRYVLFFQDGELSD